MSHPPLLALSLIHLGPFLNSSLWFAVFHVTDQLGNKLTDEKLVLYIKQVSLSLSLADTIHSIIYLFSRDKLIIDKMQALCETRRCGNSSSQEVNTCLGIEMRPCQKDTALEMTGTDRPGLMSEISAVLAGLCCNVTAAIAWTHNTRAACILYVENGRGGGPITDPIRLAHVQEQLQHVVEAHHGMGEKRSVRLTTPAPGRTHTERRLHQLMYADGDYEWCRGCDGGGAAHKQGCDRTHVTIERCEEKGYWIVNVRSRDRPKLLFDTVCALTDLEYVVFHAAVASKGNMADQVLLHCIDKVWRIQVLLFMYGI